MNKWLIDTNVTLRLGDESAQVSEEAVAAVGCIAEIGDVLYVTPQVLMELWCAATRPVDVNGSGWSLDEVSDYLNAVLSKYELLEGSPAVFENWRQLVQAHQRRGKQVHDARLVAVMKAHSVENLLTFNVEDFAAYDEIKAVHPRDVT